MYTGMLWFDNNPIDSLAVKIQKAVDYYIQKYDRAPELCLVNPSLINGNKAEVTQAEQTCKLTIRTYKPILPGHFWIGVEELPKVVPVAIVQDEDAGK